VGPARHPIRRGAGRLRYLPIRSPRRGGQHLVDLSGPDSQTAINAIEETIQSQVTKAITDKLSSVDKAEIGLGLKHPDTVIDHGFIHLTVGEHDSTTPVLLAFGAGSDHSYEIDGSFRVTADPCETELIAVEAAQQAIANTRGALRQLAGAPENASTERKMEQLEAELAHQKAELTTAESDLDRCRLLHPTEAGDGAGAVAHP
jgi:hypothetical protein